jgi:hypothetical protein
MGKLTPTLQVKYQKQTLEGQVIENIKDTERNASNYVRHHLAMFRGYDVLKQNNASPEEIIRFCTECVQFFHLQNELASYRLSQELKKSDALAEEKKYKVSKN